MAGELECEVEPSKDETERIRKDEAFLIKMLKELDVASRKGKPEKPDSKMRKMTSFFSTVQPPRTRIHVEQHEEMEWEEQEDVTTDMEVDPHDWLKMEKSRDRAIRLRGDSCQRKACSKLLKEKEDNL